MNSYREHFFAGHVREIENILSGDRSLASQPIALPESNLPAHPLHRICDGVFLGNFSQETGLTLAKVFLKYGASVNPDLQPGKDSPLTAACSMRCDELAIFYIEQGANVNHPGCHGGTALHWAAWCGRDKLVETIVPLHSNINQLCAEFKSTPLFWAIHGLKFGGKENKHHQVNCARILLENGADSSIPNFEGYLPIQLLDEVDRELEKLLSK